MALNHYQKEYIKCASDPIYFLNNYGFVFNAKKRMVTEMKCFGYQEQCLSDFNEYQNNIILKSRQTGLSVITAGYVAWRLLFRKDEKILIVANDGDGAVRFLATVKQFLDYTPNWLAPGGGEREIDNQKFIKLPNNSYAQAKASSPQAGRGDSLTLLVLDETAFIEHAESIWMAAGMALSATHGKCIMISTPNGTGNLYHETWEKAESKENDFHFNTVHWTENEFCAEGLELRTNTDGEEEKWSPWYEEQCRRYQYDSVKIAQELDLSFEGSKRLAIENELISKYEKRFLLDGYKEIMNNKTYYDYKADKGKRFVDYETDFHVFKKYVPGHNYLIGNDVARGDGSDFSTSHVIDIDTLEVVAEFRGHLAPDIFANLIYNVAHDYGEAYVVVEANSFGLGTGIDLNRKMGYTKMYFSKSIQEIYVRPYDYKIVEDETIPGFQTTKRTRPLIVNNLRSHLRDGSLRIYSKRVMAELRTFIQKGDRPEAEKGKHDDLIMALCIALYVRDTEYQTALDSKEMYKGLLEGMGHSSTSIDGEAHNTLRPEEEEAKVSDVPPDAGGIFLNKVGNDVDDDDFNNLNWLLG